MERITGDYCVDLDAVYVVGHSLGASFANSLACARAHRIRAVASVAGGITPSDCAGEVAVASVAGGVTPSDCAGEVAALLLHNPRDQAVPVSEGERARDVLLGRQAAEERPVRRSIGAFECELHGEWENPLLWCLHGQDVAPAGRFYPHQWPEGAAQGILEFFDMLAS